MDETVRSTVNNKSALIERINQKLTNDSQNEKESRFEESPSFGHFYGRSDQISERPGDVDLEGIGRELDVLEPAKPIK
jgi:hypothetical protein